MSEIDNIPDVSEYQGTINWSQVPAPIALIKMSDGETYFDKQANANYYGAKNAGKAVGMYHFAEGTDAFTEAIHFIQAVSPLEENDVLILDFEVSVNNPVAWVQTFMQTVYDRIHTWPLLYINLSTLNSQNWSPILLTCGLWLADWNNNPQGNIPTNHVYVMQQYTDAGSVPGIAGRVDEDAWFGTVEQFKAYGYHAPAAPSPAPTPLPTPPVPDPAPIAPTPLPTPDPVVTPPVVTPPTDPVVLPPAGQPVTGPVTYQPPKGNFIQNIISAIVKVIQRFWNYKV